MKAFLIAATLAGLVSVATLQAGTASPCSSQGLTSLQDYENLDGQCAVGILDFSGFELLPTSSASGGATLLTASQIDLTPVPNGTGEGGGFTINAAPGFSFAVGQGQTATYIIDWFFTVDPGPIASGASLDMDPPFGDVIILQDYCNNAFFETDANGNPIPECVNQSQTNFSPPFAPQVLQVTTEDQRNSITFPSPGDTFASVMTTITLNGDDPNSQGCPTGASGACFDNTSSSADVPAPEPVTSLLAVGGLLGLALFRKRIV